MRAHVWSLSTCDDSLSMLSSADKSRVNSFSYDLISVIAWGGMGAPTSPSTWLANASEVCSNRLVSSTITRLVSMQSLRQRSRKSMGQKQNEKSQLGGALDTQWSIYHTQSQCYTLAVTAHYSRLCCWPFTVQKKQKQINRSKEDPIPFKSVLFVNNLTVI